MVYDKPGESAPSQDTLIALQHFVRRAQREVLALNPYAAGSHRAFFDGWCARSRHDWTVVELPGWNWKWRMRTASVELADRARALWADGTRWDGVLCTDMMNAAEWRGLAPAGGV